MNNRPRIVFVGNVRASVVALRSILGLNDVEVAAVITKRNSSFNSDHTNLSPIAEEAALPYKYVSNINAGHIHDWIRSFQPSALFVAGWSQLLTPETLSLTPLGAVGFHPALLPVNRGRHPLIWAIVLGLESTGSTFFVMDEKADSGAILSQARIAIGSRETSASLYDKVEDSMGAQIPEFLPSYLRNDLEPKPQVGGGNAWRKRFRDDGLIDFRMSSEAIDRLVRALCPPYPGAEVERGRQRYAVTEAYPVWNGVPPNIEPGKIISVDSQSREITVKTSDAAIGLTKHTIDPLPHVGEYF